MLRNERTASWWYNKLFYQLVLANDAVLFQAQRHTVLHKSPDRTWRSGSFSLAFLLNFAIEVNDAIREYLSWILDHVNHRVTWDPFPLVVDHSARVESVADVCVCEWSVSGLTFDVWNFSGQNSTEKELSESKTDGRILTEVNPWKNSRKIVTKK